MMPEYLRLHGRMVNALMQVKHRWGELLNEYLSAMNIPTQDDLRTLQRRVQEHRREIRQMRQEIAELRKGTSTSTAASSSATPAPKKGQPRKKTVARKKTATKKS
jgi:predicted  nucleic acid-binding Zn-ribbon protein